LPGLFLFFCYIKPMLFFGIPKEFFCVHDSSG
jgi:hypothetical protein